MENTQRTINNLFVKVSGKLNVKDMFELGDVVDGVMRCEVVKKELKDNMDGTLDITYILKPSINYEFKKK